MSDPDLAAVDLGRLARLKFKKNTQAREDALGSIRYITGLACWRVRIGGRVRGQILEFLTREQAEKAVHDHYNEQMMQFIRRP